MTVIKLSLLICFIITVPAPTKKIETDLDAESAKGITKKQWEKVKGQANEILTALIKDLQKHMSKGEDW